MTNAINEIYEGFLTMGLTFGLMIGYSIIGVLMLGIGAFIVMLFLPRKYRRKIASFALNMEESEFKKFILGRG